MNSVVVWRSAWVEDGGQCAVGLCGQTFQHRWCAELWDSPMFQVLLQYKVLALK